jgi:hypothetical protein
MWGGRVLASALCHDGSYMKQIQSKLNRGQWLKWTHHPAEGPGVDEAGPEGQDEAGLEDERPQHHGGFFLTLTT